MAHEFILVIDDDINLSQSIAYVLKHKGYLVSTIDNALTAVELITTGDYRLAILDTHMKDAKSVLIPEILRAYPHLPMIILTDPPLTDTEKGNGRGNVVYLGKPVAPELLLDKVKSILDTMPCLNLNLKLKVSYF